MFTTLEVKSNTLCQLVVCRAGTADFVDSCLQSFGCVRSLYEFRGSVIDLPDRPDNKRGYAHGGEDVHVHGEVEV